MLDHCLANILKKYGHIRSRSSLRAGGDGAKLFAKLRSAIESTKAVQSRPHLECDWSIGKGNWSAVPWIRLIDDRFSSRKRGLLCAYLFREDMTGVYLVIMQSVYRFSTKKGLQVLQNRASDIAAGYHQDLPNSFRLATDSDIDLRSKKLLPELYEAAIVIAKFYYRDRMPEAATCHNDLENLLICYEELAASISNSSLATARGN